MGTWLYGDSIIEEEGKMDIGGRQLVISQKVFLAPSSTLL